MPSKERRKGHDYERLLVKKFRERGYDEAQTSRYASRFHDDNLIDLVNVPMHVQAKAVKKSVAYRQLLEDMQRNIREKKLEELPCAIFHKRGRKETEELVVMTAKDFWTLFAYLQETENQWLQKGL